MDRSITDSMVDDVHDVFISSLQEEKTSTNEDMSEDGTSTSRDTHTKIFLSTLFPADCSTLLSAMKALINGFITGEPTDASLEGKANLILFLCFCLRLHKCKSPSDCMFKSLFKPCAVNPIYSSHLILKAQVHKKRIDKPSAASTLAPYDINVLEAWFSDVKENLSM